jgi:4-hydroxy-2-oxoheptanedioate aldolase
MVTNTVKQRLQAGKSALGSCLVLGSPTAAAIMARAGLDFVLLDYQHGEWDDGTALAAMRYISHQGVIPMTRVRENNFYTIGRALDRGSLGIIVPMVNSADEARAAAFATRYPPLGGRSYGGSLAVHYGADYDKWADREILLMVQIETAQAADRAEEILAVDGVDGCWIGPNDLARTLGCAMNTPEHTEAVLGVLEACRRTGKAPGIYTPNIDEARCRLDQGFQFVTVSGDGGLLASGTKEILRQLGREASTGPAGYIG